MKILRIPVGVYSANCYIIYDENIKEGIIVDPGGDAKTILEIVEKKELNIKYIVLTHGHGDHIGGVSQIRDALNITVLAHELEREMLIDGSKNLSSTMTTGTIEIEPDILLKDGDIIQFGGLKGIVIHTPGHSKGGICLKIEDVLITGDTLFKDSIGRTDLIGGDYKTIINSIKEKLLIYPNHTKVYPGHGLSSTLEEEKYNNPFLQ